MADSGSGSATAGRAISNSLRLATFSSVFAAVQTRGDGRADHSPMMRRRLYHGEFLGVPYWDVVLAASGSLHLLRFDRHGDLPLSVRLLPRHHCKAAGIALREIVDRIFFGSVVCISFSCHPRSRRTARRRPYGPTCWCAGRGFLYFKYVRETLARGRDAVRQHRRGSKRMPNDSYLTLLLARSHHDRPVHDHRVHQPHGSDAARRRFWKSSHDPDGYLSLDPRRRLPRRQLTSSAR